MTALDLLPTDTKAAVLRPDRSLRGDLLAIPKAEAEGWTVTFRDNNWHNAAEFARGDVRVWLARQPFGGPYAWRSALIHALNFTGHQWHFNLGDALLRKEPTT